MSSADQPPAYAYVSRVTTSSLRSVVIPFAVLGAIWSLVGECGEPHGEHAVDGLRDQISLFQELKTDRDQHEKRLATFAIVLGSLYAGATAIFVFGVVAGATKRLALIRIFSFLMVVATVIVIAAGLLRTIIHFMLKDALITECTALAQGHDVVFRWGIWEVNPKDNLTPEEANSFCKSAWKRDSVSEIFWLLGVIIMMGLFTLVAFAYAQQETAGVSGNAQARLPASYTPAYGAGPSYAAGAGESTADLPEVHYDHEPYAPPAGPPPGFDKSLPSYGGGEADKKDLADDPFADFEDAPRR
ncbi:hypothetical protein BC834DRAFT_968866 [Gloeopeniophorella convolvens]|nr:hypothetical protein BC834DRAFT_968866 [Gloeopeniophorella convolvens]